MKAISRSIRITPKKINLIAELVRSKDATQALEILTLTPKKGAKILHKIVASAVANAKNNFKQDENSLYIKEILVNKAPTMKRWMPASRGRVHPILKRNSKVTVTIGVKETTKETTTKKAEATSSKTTAKAETTKKVTPKKETTPKAKTESKAAPKTAEKKEEPKTKK